MSKYRIRIFSDYGSSEGHKGAYESFCRASLINNYGEDKEIYITSGDDFTHVVVINTYIPSNIGHIPKQNVIGLAMEPPQFLNFSHEFREFAQKHVGKYFLGDVKIHNLGEPFVEHFGFVGHQPPNYEVIEKTNLMSIMVSDKKFSEGHIYRHQLVKEILKNPDLQIDIWGRGCQYYGEDKRLKGTFPNERPMLEPYHFNICIENFRTNHYISEKGIDPLSHSTTPIYLGCYNIDSYFPDTFIHLSGSLEQDMKLIREIYENPEKYKKNIDIHKKHELFEGINLLKNLDKIFDF